MLELMVPDGGGLRRGACCVSISGKFRRILIFKEAYDEMRQHCGHDFSHVQFWSDRYQPDRFWMRPVTEGAEACSRVVLNPVNKTRSISASHVLKRLGWKTEQSVRCSLGWDVENNAAVVSLGT